MHLASDILRHHTALIDCMWLSQAEQILLTPAQLIKAAEHV